MCKDTPHKSEIVLYQTEDGGLSENSIVKDSLTTALDSKRYVTKIYNLDAIFAVGYRVRSPLGK